MVLGVIWRGRSLAAVRCPHHHHHYLEQIIIIIIIIILAIKRKFCHYEYRIEAVVIVIKKISTSIIESIIKSSKSSSGPDQSLCPHHHLLHQHCHQHHHQVAGQPGPDSGYVSHSSGGGYPKLQVDHDDNSVDDDNDFVGDDDDVDDEKAVVTVIPAVGDTQSNDSYNDFHDDDNLVWYLSLDLP